MTTFVYYFIPEDNENENKMNIFIIYKNYKDVKIQDIKDNMDKNVWIDFNNPVGALPKYDGKIIMKVTRLSWEDKQQEQKQPSPDSLFM